MNYDEYLAEVQKDALEIKNVPADMLTPEICIEAIKNVQLEGKDLEEFIEENTPEEARTDLFYEEMVAKDPELIKLVPPKMLTDRICKIAGITMKELAQEADEILKGNEQVTTMEDLVKGLDGKDNPTTDNIWKALATEADEISKVNDKVDTMKNVAKGLDDKDSIGDDDRDTMTDIALEISKTDEFIKSIEDKMAIVASQRSQIADKKKELSLSKSASLEAERNGIDR